MAFSVCSCIGHCQDNECSLLRRIDCWSVQAIMLMSNFHIFICVTEVIHQVPINAALIHLTHKTLMIFPAIILQNFFNYSNNISV